MKITRRPVCGALWVLVALFVAWNLLRPQGSPIQPPPPPPLRVRSQERAKSERATALTMKISASNNKECHLDVRRALQLRYNGTHWVRHEGSFVTLHGLFPKSDPSCVALFSGDAHRHVWERLACVVVDRHGREAKAAVARVFLSEEWLQDAGTSTTRVVDFELQYRVAGDRRAQWDRVRLFDGGVLVADAAVRFPAGRPAPAPDRRCAVRVCTKVHGDGGRDFKHGQFSRDWLGHLRSLGVASVVVNAIGEIVPAFKRDIESGGGDLVTLRAWPARLTAADRASAHAGEHRSTLEAYARLAINHCYRESAEFDWVVPVDIDEFLRTRGCVPLCEALAAHAGNGRGDRTRFKMSGVVHHPRCRRGGKSMSSGFPPEVHPPCPGQFAKAEAAAKTAAANPEGRVPDDGPESGWKAIWRPRTHVHAYAGLHGPASPFAFPLLPIDRVYMAHVNDNERAIERPCASLARPGDCPGPPFADAEFRVGCDVPG